MEHDIITCKNGTWICKCSATGPNRTTRIVHEKAIEDYKRQLKSISPERVLNESI